MVDDADDTGLAGDGLGAPREVAGVEAESAELAVAATGADQMDTLGADTGVGWLSEPVVSTPSPPHFRGMWECTHLPFSKALHDTFMSAKSRTQ